jgi:hypothetical protein
VVRCAGLCSHANAAGDHLVADPDLQPGRQGPPSLPGLVESTHYLVKARTASDWSAHVVVWSCRWWWVQKKTY